MRRLTVHVEAKDWNNATSSGTGKKCEDKTSVIVFNGDRGFRFTGLVVVGPTANIRGCNSVNEDCSSNSSNYRKCSNDGLFKNKLPAQTLGSFTSVCFIEKYYASDLYACRIVLYKPSKCNIKLYKNFKLPNQWLLAYC
jgi:hypothetical protein